MAIEIYRPWNWKSTIIQGFHIRKFFSGRYSWQVNPAHLLSSFVVIPFLSNLKNKCHLVNVRINSNKNNAFGNYQVNLLKFWQTFLKQVRPKRWSFRHNSSTGKFSSHSLLVWSSTAPITDETWNDEKEHYIVCIIDWVWDDGTLVCLSFGIFAYILNLVIPEYMLDSFPVPIWVPNERITPRVTSVLIPR